MHGFCCACALPGSASSALISCSPCRGMRELNRADLYLDASLSLAGDCQVEHAVALLHSGICTPVADSLACQPAPGAQHITFYLPAAQGEAAESRTCDTAPMSAEALPKHPNTLARCVAPRNKSVSLSSPSTHSCTAQRSVVLHASVQISAFRRAVTHEVIDRLQSEATAGYSTLLRQGAADLYCAPGRAASPLLPRMSVRMCLSPAQVVQLDLTGPRAPGCR